MNSATSSASPAPAGTATITLNEGFFSRRNWFDWLFAAIVAVGGLYALQRYGSPFEKRMAQVKMSTEQARALVDAAPDDEDKLGAAVVRLSQERIFGLLVDLEIDPENVDVNKLFKNAAEIGKASVTQKKFSQSVRAEIEAAARKALIDEQRGKLDALGRSGAVPADVLAQVIKAAYDL